jgi:hypothetical protein
MCRIWRRPTEFSVRMPVATMCTKARTLISACWIMSIVAVQATARERECSKVPMVSVRTARESGSKRVIA